MILIIFYINNFLNYIFKKEEVVSIINILMVKFFNFTYSITNWFLINYLDVTNIFLLIDQFIRIYQFNIFFCIGHGISLFKQVVTVLGFLTSLVAYVFSLFTTKLLILVIFGFCCLSAGVIFLAVINYLYLIFFYKYFFISFFLTPLKLYLSFLKYGVYYLFFIATFIFKPFLIIYKGMYSILKFCFILILKIHSIDFIIVFLKVQTYKLMFFIISYAYVPIFKLIFYYINIFFFYLITIFFKLLYFLLILADFQINKFFIGWDTITTSNPLGIVCRHIFHLELPTFDIYNWDSIFPYKFRKFWTIHIYNNFMYYSHQYFIAFLVYIKLKIYSILNFFIDFPITIRNTVVYFYKFHWKMYKIGSGEEKIALIKYYAIRKKAQSLLRVSLFLIYGLMQYPILILNSIVDLFVNYFILVTKSNAIAYIELKQKLYLFNLFGEYIFEPIFFVLIYIQGLAYYAITHLSLDYLFYYNQFNYYGFTPNIARAANPYLITLILQKPIHLISGLLVVFSIYLKFIYIELYYQIFLYLEFFTSILNLCGYYYTSTIPIIFLTYLNLKDFVALFLNFDYYSILGLKIYHFSMFFIAYIYYTIITSPLPFLCLFLTVISTLNSFFGFIFNFNTIKLVLFHIFFSNPIMQFLGYFLTSIGNFQFPHLTYFLLKYLFEIWLTIHGSLAYLSLQFASVFNFFSHQNYLKSLFIFSVPKIAQNFDLHDFGGTIIFLKIEIFFSFFFIVYALFFIRMILIAWSTYFFFNFSFLVMELDDLVDLNNKNFKEMFFKIYHSEMAPDIGIKTLSTLRQPKSVINKFYKEWFSGSHIQFRQQPWRLLSRRTHLPTVTSKNLFFTTLEYCDFFEKENHFYSGVDYLKHVRYTFFRIIYSYFRIYGFYNFKIFSRFARFLTYNGFNKKKVGFRRLRTKHTYFYYSLPLFTLNFLPKYTYAYKLANAKIQLVNHFNNLKSAPGMLVSSCLLFSNFFWLIYHILIHMPAMGVNFIKVCFTRTMINFKKHFFKN
jgi:hypothetical protein